MNLIREALEAMSQHRKGYNVDGSYRDTYSENTAECGKNWCRVMTLVDKALTALRTGKLVVVDGYGLREYITTAEMTLEREGYDRMSVDEWLTYLQGESTTPESDYLDEIDAETAGDWKAHEYLDEKAGVNNA